jgi:AraC-like DNA-binding protein
MMNFPLPILSFLMAVIAATLMWRVDFGLRSARYLFTGFFGLVAAGALLVGMRFGYGIEAFIPVQRSLPLLCGPMLYLGFAVLAAPSVGRLRLIAAHLGGAIAGSVLVQVLPPVWAGLDSAIAISYAVYGVALVLLWRNGPNHLIHARLDLIDRLRGWMLWAAGFLIAMLLADSAIAISFALHRSDAAVQLISFGSVVLIGGMVLVILTVSSLGQKRAEAIGAVAKPDENDLEQAARAFLTSSQLYLDTGLTIERLAKRMHVPMRSLSAAINQSKGVNVSQYVNGFRLAHAAELLRSTDLSVTEIAAQSGFLTRSNFYREFQRAYAQTPAAYRQGQSKA